MLHSSDRKRARDAQKKPPIPARTGEGRHKNHCRFKLPFDSEIFGKEKVKFSGKISKLGLEIGFDCDRSGKISIEARGIAGTRAVVTSIPLPPPTGAGFSYFKASCMSRAVVEIKQRPAPMQLNVQTGVRR